MTVLIHSTRRRCFFILLISMLISQAFAQSPPGLAIKSHTVYEAAVGSAQEQPSWKAWKTEIEIPGTKQTVEDLTAASYFKEEIYTLLNQLDDMDRGWADNEGGDFDLNQTSQPPQTSPTPPTEPEHPDLLDGTMSVEGDLADDNAPQTSFFRRQTMLSIDGLHGRERCRRTMGLTSVDHGACCGRISRMHEMVSRTRSAAS